MSGPLDYIPADAGSDLRPGYAGPPATFGETVAAAQRQYEAARLFTSPNLYAGRVGKQVVDALRAKGRTGFTGADGRKVAYGDKSLRSDYALNPTVAPRIWADVAAERERDPSFLAGLSTPEEFDAAVIAARRKDYDEANETLGRSSGLTGLAGELTGGLIGSLEDPIQLTALGATAGLPAGRLGLGILEKLFGGKLALGTATKIASEGLGNAIVNVAATAPTLPLAAERSAEIGVEMTGRDVAMELGQAALAGAIMGAGPPAIGAGARAAAPVVAAGARSVRRMVRDLRKLDRPLTPAEADALPVLEQAARDIAASPFPPTPVGDAVHAERLTEAVDALENDRPLNPAVFETPAPPVKPGAEAATVREPAFDPTPHLAAAETYVRDRKAGPVTPEALAEKLGISRGQATDVLLQLTQGGRNREILRVSYDVKRGRTKFSRPAQRSGPVDLITRLADLGGIRDDQGHNLATRWNSGSRTRTEGNIGRVFVPKAGPLFRPEGMSIEEVAQWLHQNGWVQDNGVGGGIPTEAEVIDLIDRAVRQKMYHPEEAAIAMEAQRAKANAANDGQLDEYRAQVREYAQPLIDALPENSPARLTEDDITAIAETLDRFDGDVEEAIFAHWQQLADEAEAEAAAFDPEAYDVPFDEGDNVGTADRTAAQDGAGQQAVAGNAGEGRAGGGGAGSEREGPPSAADAAAGDKALEAFDTPQGEGPAAQVEALQHDLRAEVEAAADTPEGIVRAARKAALPQYGHSPAAVAAAEAFRKKNKDTWTTFLQGYSSVEAGQPSNAASFYTGGDAVGKAYEAGRAAAEADIRKEAAAMQAAPAEAAPATVLDDPERLKAELGPNPEQADFARVYASLPKDPEIWSDVRLALQEAYPDKVVEIIEAIQDAGGRPKSAEELARAADFATYQQERGAIAQRIADAMARGGEFRLPNAVRGRTMIYNRPDVVRATATGLQVLEGRKWVSLPGNYLDAVLASVEATARPADPAPVGDTATGSLGLDAEQAPAGGMTERQRAEMAARLQQSQMRRGGQQSVDQISGGLFDAARDQLDAFAMPDGSTVSKADLLAEFDADDAALKIIKDCL